ncbi:NAD(P)H-binding protein [Algiphilus sp.]|uniref:NAD(P)H-binding protein n=1 Tax=Algiphilus sp. TaxID=1872431 RepID=UPI003B52BA73
MILVLGAGGTVGGHLCRELEARDVEFRAAYYSLEKLEAALEEDMDAVEVDLARPQTLRAAMEDIDRLFLLTAATPRLAELERNAIAAAARAEVRQVVKISVWEADQQDYSFARWHAPSEQALADSGIAHSILRPNGFMQSAAQGMEATVRDHGAFYTASAQAPIAYVDARDVAACAAALLVDDPPVPDRRIWELSGGEALTAAEVAQALSRAVHKPVRAVEVTTEVYRNGLLAAGLPEWLTDALVDMAGSQAEAGFGRVTEDIETLTGRKPRSMADYFEETRENFLA